MLTLSGAEPYATVPQQATCGTIDCGRQATLTHVGSLHLSLLSALRDGGVLHLELSELDAIDASFVQLVVSAAKTVRQAGQVMTLAPSAEVRDAFARAGLIIDPTTGHLALN